MSSEDPSWLAVGPHPVKHETNFHGDHGRGGLGGSLGISVIPGKKSLTSGSIFLAVAISPTSSGRLKFTENATAAIAWSGLIGSKALIGGLSK